MKRLRLGLLVIGVAWIVHVPIGGAATIRSMNDEMGDGKNVNLIVREIRATPARAKAGDPVRIEMVLENQAEGAGSVRASITANGREVSHALYNYGWGGEGGRITRQAFVWDTKGVRPGNYRIKGSIFAWEDTSPSDNEMAIDEPVVILPADSNEPAGGSVFARDPRYRPAAPEGAATH
jgi:uncharacterized protein (DUF58 family)